MKVYCILSIIVCISLSFLCQGYAPRSNLPSNRVNSSLNLQNPFTSSSKSVKNQKQPLFETKIIPGDYRVAAGFLALSLGLLIGLGNFIAGIPVGLIGILLFVQTGRVRFVFDADSMEVKRVDKTAAIDTSDESQTKLKSSGENFAVGGANRWKYNTWKNWFFIPSKDFPILM